MPADDRIACERDIGPEARAHHLATTERPATTPLLTPKALAALVGEGVETGYVTTLNGAHPARIEHARRLATRFIDAQDRDHLEQHVLNTTHDGWDLRRGQIRAVIDSLLGPRGSAAGEG